MTTHHRPLDARQMPRFAGVRTFMREPHTTDLAGVDAAVYGIPFDTATTYRTGTRFGPEAIRSASALLRPYNPALEVNVTRPPLPAIAEDEAEPYPAVAAVPAVWLARTTVALFQS